MTEEIIFYLLQFFRVLTKQPSKRTIQNICIAGNSVSYLTNKMCREKMMETTGGIVEMPTILSFMTVAYVL